MKYINLKNLVILAAVVVGFAPLQTFAATVYLEASRNTISVGDTAIVTVKINAEAAVLNSVDGDITLKASTGNVAVQEFSLANSSFGLWPRTPSLSTDGRTISFVGGVPGGFSIEGATLFKIIVQATKAGTISINPQNISVFINDGKGTKAAVQIKGTTIEVTPSKSGSAVNNDWSSIVSTDRTPPAPFIIVPGQDDSLFAGKKFAFFSAVDNQTGIDHYDVSENGGTAVRSGSTYVFQDQSGNATLNVIAYDKAGNKVSAVYPVEAGNGIHWQVIILVIVILLVIYGLYKVVSKKVKNKKHVSKSL